jgi:hypothetical protein
MVLTKAYLDNSFDRAPLIELLIVAACRFGNDPHLQELGLCFVEDYFKAPTSRRDLFLLAQVNHTTGYRRFDDTLELYERFTDAMGLARN